MSRLRRSSATRACCCSRHSRSRRSIFCATRTAALEPERGRLPPSRDAGSARAGLAHPRHTRLLRRTILASRRPRSIRGPCTETVIEAVLDSPTRRLARAADPRSRHRHRFGVLLSRCWPSCRLPPALATDISDDALRRRPGQRGAARRCGARHVPEPAQPRRRRRLQLLISNPPYIATADIALLEAEVRRCSILGPHSMDGGDGLDGLLAEIGKGCSNALPCGWGLFEVGAGQAEDVERLLGQAQALPAPLPMAGCQTDWAARPLCCSQDTGLTRKLKTLGFGPV